MFHPVGEQRFRDDDGSAHPAVTTALSAFAAAQGSEHAALTALSGIRLLVPLVAVLTPAAGGRSDAKASEMALPTLVGRDGRRAIPAFTCLEALARWQPSARPVPADAASVWRGAAEDACSVVIDVAGPVPLAVEGARLAALAAGAPVPLPHDDPDVRDVIAEVLAQLAAAGGFTLGDGGFVLRPAEPDSDLLIELAVPATLDSAAAEDFAAQVGSAVLDRLASRLCRGIAIAIAPEAGSPLLSSQ